MSGGSWDYVYQDFRRVADKLSESADPWRRVLARKIYDMADALHDIEWVDSGDYPRDADREAIRKALGDFADEQVLSVEMRGLMRMMEDMLERMEARG